MNFVSISPQFPPNFVNFWVQLRRMGATVLGIADNPYDELPIDLKTTLGEYYRVSNQHNYDEMLRALGYFTYRYGKIDRIESHNEYWLEQDARLRTDFNVFGLKSSEMAPMKRKSEMKKRFIQAGIPVARGRICYTIGEAEAFISEVGYPVVAKPDSGVGANQTYKLHNHEQLVDLFAIKPPVDYIFEEFINGDIQTFDGLTDRDGRIVFYSSLAYNAGVMELVNDRLDFWYYTMRDIPPALEAAGRRLVKSYGLRERFFHMEFFCTGEDRYVGLEVNIRPPGGMTVDMWNYANDIDIYREYANVVVNNVFGARAERPYHIAYVSRRRGRNYEMSHDEVMTHFGSFVVAYEPISGVFAPALGDFGYLIRSPYLEELAEIASYMHKQF